MRTRTTLCALALTAMLTAPALAQRGGGMMMGGSALLMNPGVQAELKLDDEQKEKVQAYAQESMEEMRSAFQELQDLEGDARAEKMATLRTEMAEKNQKAMAKLMKPEQIKRFEQIELQARGLQAFMDPKVAEKLKPTDEQKEKLREIAEDSQSAMREAFMDAQGGDRQAAMARIGELRTESMKKALALMTDEQKKAWEEMTGKPFQLQLGRGRPQG
jgi:Spy/CpxP family protein refolding chaperone